MGVFLVLLLAACGNETAKVAPAADAVATKAYIGQQVVSVTMWPRINWSYYAGVGVPSTKACPGEAGCFSIDLTYQDFGPLSGSFSYQGKRYLLNAMLDHGDWTDIKITSPTGSISWCPSCQIGVLYNPSTGSKGLTFSGQITF